MDELEEDDGPAVFRQLEVEHAAVEVLTEVVRLFAEVIDGIELSHEDVIVAGSEDGPWTLAVLDYVVPLATDIDGSSRAVVRSPSARPRSRRICSTRPACSRASGR